MDNKPETRGRKTTFDKIIREYSSGKSIEAMDLSDDDKAILERWTFIDSLKRRHRPGLSMGQIQRMTEQRFGVSKSQFWLDSKNAARLFGEMYLVDKNYQRSIMIEWAMQSASLAEAKHDFKAQAKFLELAAKLMNLFDFSVEEANKNDAPEKLVMLINIQNNMVINSQTINLDQLQSESPEILRQLVQSASRPIVGEAEMVKMLNELEEDGE